MGVFLGPVVVLLAATASATPQPTVSEGLGPADVPNFVRSKMYAVSRCYDREVATNPALYGKVVVHWTIKLDGTTDNVFVQDQTMPNLRVGPCIVRLVKHWRFTPVPTGTAVDVLFPFVFQSTGTPDAKVDVPAEPTPQPRAPDSLISATSRRDAGADAPARKPATDSNLDPAEVARYVKAHLNLVKACYERELLKHPGLTGRVVANWTIEPTGTPRNIVTHDDTMPIPSVGACIRAVIATWHFAPHTGDSIDVQFPFVFQTDGPRKPP